MDGYISTGFSLHTSGSYPNSWPFYNLMVRNSVTGYYIRRKASRKRGLVKSAGGREKFQDGSVTRFCSVLPFRVAKAHLRYPHHHDQCS